MSPHLNVSPRSIVQGALWSYSIDRDREGTEKTHVNETFEFLIETKLL